MKRFIKAAGAGVLALATLGLSGCIVGTVVGTAVDVGVEVVKVFDCGGGDCSGAFCYEFFEVVEVWEFPFD